MDVVILEEQRNFILLVFLYEFKLNPLQFQRQFILREKRLAHMPKSFTSCAITVLPLGNMHLVYGFGSFYRTFTVFFGQKKEIPQRSLDTQFCINLI